MIKMGIIIDKRIKNVIAFLITFLETIYICNLIQLSEKELFWIIFLGGVIVKNGKKLYSLLALAISIYISFAFYK